MFYIFIAIFRFMNKVVDCVVGLQCGSEKLEKWMNLIGIKNPVKLTRYLVWKRFGFCPPHTTLKQREDFLNGKLDINSQYLA
jgi:hypothetical protein